MLKRSNRWGTDLMALREGQIDFTRFAQRHAGIVRDHAKRWVGSALGRADLSDLIQEVLLVIWRAVDQWDPERAVPLDMFVRRQVRYRMLTVCGRERKKHDRDRNLGWRHAVGDDVEFAFMSGADDDSSTLVAVDPLPLPGDELADVEHMLHVAGGAAGSALVSVIAGSTRIRRARIRVRGAAAPQKEG